MTTVVDAVDTQDTFVGVDLGGRAAGSFTVLFTDVAERTIHVDFTDSPQRKAAQYPEKRSCRTDKSAEKTRNHQIQ